MRNLRERIVVIFLLVLMVVPLYVWMTNVVSALEGHDLIGSFELRSGRKSTAANVFNIGDSLVVSAESVAADVYELEIYDNSSLVLAEDGEFEKGIVEIAVSLVPPLFHAGHAYVVFFEVCSYDYPIPGSFSRDSAVSSFSVTGVETELGLTVEYVALIGDLCLEAYVATINGDDVEYVFVNFLLQSADDARVTEGWVPIGSRKSDYTGWARMHVAFSLSSGDYRVKAVFEGNADYGRSENVTEISIESSNVGVNGYGSSYLKSAPFTAFGNLSLVASNSAPYALVPMSVEAYYHDDVLLEGPTWMVFFLDYFSGSAFLSASVARNGSSGGGGGGGGGGGKEFEKYGVSDPVVVEAEGGTWWYLYPGSLFWAPQMIGLHTIIVGVVNGALSDLENAIQSGSDFLAMNSTVLDIQPCPVNIVLNYPDAFYGDVFPVEAVVSKPRPYEACVDDFFTTTSLAPRLSYGGVEYVVDDVVESVALEFYVNGSLTGGGLTDASGLACFELNANFTSANVGVLLDNSPLFADALAEEFLALSEVGVYRTQNPANDDFGFNFTVNGLFGDDGFYVGVENQLRAEVGLLNQCVWNLPLSIVYAESLGSSELQPSPINIPVTSDYLQVREWTVDPLGAIVYDNHYAPEDAYFVFDSGQTAYADSRGFAYIPSGATEVTVYNADPLLYRLEFFKVGMNPTLRTGNFGEVVHGLGQAETGRYLIQLRLCENPVSLTLVNGNNSIFSVGGQMNLVGFFNVVERPVHLSLSNSPGNVTVGSPVDLVVDAVDGVSGEPCSGLPIEFSVDDASLGIVSTNAGMAVLSWIPVSSIVYDVVVNYDGNVVYDEASASLSLDLRTPTNVRLWLMDRRVESATARIHVNADAQVFSDAPDMNYGSSYILRAGTDSSANIYRSFLKFSLASLGNIIGISDARLLCWADTVAQSPRIEARKVFDDSWVESGITWNNKPSCDGDVLDTVLVDSVSAYTSWTVTTFVQEEFAGDKTLSLLLKSEDEKITSKYAAFYSKEEPSGINSVDDFTAESSNPDPYLEVTYTYYVYYRDREILDNEALNVDAFTDYRFSGEGLPAGGASTSANIYVNGSLYDTKTTNQGSFTFDWRAEQLGLCYFNVSFGGTQNYKPSNVYFVAMVQAAPATVLFEVLPCDFAVPSSLTLRATVRHASTGELIVGHGVDFYKVGTNNVTELIDHNKTGSDGVASLSYNYNGGIYAFKAVAERQMATSSGTMVTVGNPTTLDLSVSKDASSYAHYISGTLRSGTSGVAGKVIKIYVNDTLKDAVTTVQGWEGEGVGEFYKALSLEPLNNQPTVYQIMVSYEGDFEGNATAYADLPDGTSHAVCSTVKYDYKPAVNSTVLRVSPPSTEATQPTKTPEQLQQEAQQNEWMKPPEPRFSWFFPWFRLHFLLDINLPQGNPKIDYGWSFLPGGESYAANFTVLAEALSEFSLEIKQDILTSYVIGFAIRAGIYLFMGANAAALAVALALYWGLAAVEALHFYFTSGSNPKAWLAAFFVQLWGLGIGFVEGIMAAGRFLTATARWILGTIKHPMNAMWKMRLNFLIISGILFTISDFLIMLMYLTAYLAAF